MSVNSQKNVKLTGWFGCQPNQALLEFNMALPKFILAGNWKMNLRLEDALALTDEVISLSSDMPATHEVWLSVPAPYLYPLSKLQNQRDTEVKLGAQHCHGEDSGAYTGEISLPMLLDTGAGFTLIGHSERRQFFGETIESAAARALSLLDQRFPVIFCVGESLAEREAGTTAKIIQNQLSPVLKSLSVEAGKFLVVAYEPVWAIGTGKVASLTQIQEAHKLIKGLLQAKGFDAPVLYGGSVKPDNFKGIASIPEVNGGLVGGASLSGESFGALISIAKNLV